RGRTHCDHSRPVRCQAAGRGSRPSRIVKGRSPAATCGIVCSAGLWGAAMSPSNHDDKAPLPEIAGYRLLRLISRGGMSSVYLAEQVALSRQVAVKVMAPQALSDEVSRRRFENEVRTIARLDHPHVVR